MAINVCTYVYTVITYYSKCMDQPGKVADPARDQLNRENCISLSAPENLASRDGFGRSVSRVSLLLSILWLNLVLTYEIPPDFLGGVHLFI